MYRFDGVSEHCQASVELRPGISAEIRANPNPITSTDKKVQIK
jgi:hypothetical protein